MAASPIIWKSVLVDISESTTISEALKVLGYDVVAIQQAADSEGTTLTFQGSYDGVTFAAIKDGAGNSLTITKGASTAEVLLLLTKEIKGMHSIKIVCGSAQLTADTTFQVGLRAVSDTDPL